MELPKLKTIGERVKWARERLDNVSQEGLADMIGSTRAQIQKVENNKTKRPRNMEKLAEALEVPPAWLQFGYAELESLDGDAIQLAVDWASLPDDMKKAIKAAVDAAKN